MPMATRKIYPIASVILLVFCFISIAITRSIPAFATGTTANPGDVLINEVQYDPPQSGTDSAWEWVEVYNPGDDTIDMVGWSIADNAASDDLPSLSLPPHGLAIIAATDSFFDNFPACDCEVVFVGGTIGNGLSNTGDRVVLSDSAGTVIDAVSYGSDTTYMSLPKVAAGHSLERSPAGGEFVDNPDPSPCSVYAGATATPAPSPTATAVATPAPSPSPTATAVATPTGTPPAEVQPGDINGDGVVNCCDITQLELCILYPETYLKEHYPGWDADENGEGPNSGDVLAIIQRILGK